MQQAATAEAEELSRVRQEKHQVEEEIAIVQEYLNAADLWLTMHPPATVGYHETLEEWLGLRAYLAELSAQAVCLDEVASDLTTHLEHR